MSYEHYQREVAAGRAMLNAGNLDAAIRHAKTALEIDPNGVEVYLLQVDILSDKGRPAEALRVSDSRLERVPDCRDAHLQRIRYLGELGRAGHARKAMEQVRELFADDPMMIHDCQLMHDAVTGRNAYVLQRVKHLRETGYWGVMNLDALEQNAHANAGHYGKLGKLQQADLEAGLIDPDTLHTQAIVRFLQARLLTARKLAAQAEEMDPLLAPVYRETRIHATLGMVPLLWPAMLFIALTGSLTARFPWFIRMFTNYALAVVALFALAGLAVVIEAIPGLPAAVTEPLIATIGFANVGWGLYCIWALGSIGRWRASRSKSYKISGDY